MTCWEALESGSRALEKLTGERGISIPRPQQSFSSRIEWPLSIHSPRLKWTVLNPESAWREGNGDYLPGETGREMKGVGVKGRKRENERKEGGRCKKRGLRTPDFTLSLHSPASLKIVLSTPE